MRTPVAYLRKSRVFDEKANVSWEVQEAKVRELAATHGDNGGRLLILSDWNISGRKGASARPGYRQLLDMIKTDQVSALYSYNLARISRSVQEARSTFALADKHGTPVRLVADNVDTSTATGRMLFTILAAVDEMTADLASEHARDAVAIRRARGDLIGHPFYGEDPKKPGESVEAIVEAYREVGTVIGTARLLNERKIPTRQGRPWSTITVRETLVRVGAMTNRSRPGAKARAPFALYGLLRCHCGHLLTGNRWKNGSNPNYCAYKCYMNRTVPNHGRGSTPENRILAWVKEEASRLRVPFDQVEIAERDQTRRAALEAKRARSVDAALDGTIDKADRDRRLLEVAGELDRLDMTETLIDVPKTIDWDWPPEQINGVLRAMWSEVILDANLQPVRAEWNVPSWRNFAPTH